jgi:uncharacterized iron-regulated protein
MAALLFASFLVQSASQAHTLLGYVPERVYDTRRQAFTDFEVMLADLARADVVLVGEQHDDVNTHRLELAMLQGLHRRRVPVTVSLEMFERDIQPALDSYLAGSITEEEFLKGARPWPRYATDYRPLVEIARAQGWPVIASNVPRRHASEVAKAGLSALDRLTAAERASVARDLQCPFDAYFDQFVAKMKEHPPGNAGQTNSDQQRAVTERYYFSQCVKDETMAESISAASVRQDSSAGSARRPVVHFTGAFHTDFGGGTASRTRRRLDGRRVAAISILPVVDLDSLAPAGEDLRRAEYLVYTVKSAAPQSPDSNTKPSAKTPNQAAGASPRRRTP